MFRFYSFFCFDPEKIQQPEQSIPKKELNKAAFSVPNPRYIEHAKIYSENLVVIKNEVIEGEKTLIGTEIECFESCSNFSSISDSEDEPEEKLQQEINMSSSEDGSWGASKKLSEIIEDSELKNSFAAMGL